MMDASTEVSVTVNDAGQVTSIRFSDEAEPRDLDRPDGRLGEVPMSLEGQDKLIGFQTLTVLTFENADATKRICVKLMNCRYFCHP